MMTPRPDHFSYPLKAQRSEVIEMPEALQRTLFVGTLIGCFGLTLFLLARWS